MAGQTGSGKPIIRGSVVVHRRRCGKPTCRCADGENLHEATVLSYSDAGKTRFVMLPADQVRVVREAVNRYRMEKARVERRGDAGRKQLVARLARRQGRPS